MDIILAKTLYRWAKCNTDNQSQLETWLSAAITNIANGKGGSVSSTTANGVSVTFASKGLTNSQWAATISRALEMIEKGTASTTVIGTIL